jgi:glutamate-1-semialdehyde 2,1-aminomutase
MQSLQDLARQHGINDFSTDSVGGMFGIYFSPSPPRCFDDVSRCNVQQFNRFFHAMLNRGVYLAPSAYEAGFVSIAHEGDAIAHTLAAADESFREIR